MSVILKISFLFMCITQNQEQKKQTLFLYSRKDFALLVSLGKFSHSTTSTVRLRLLDQGFGSG